MDRSADVKTISDFPTCESHAFCLLSNNFILSFSFLRKNIYPVSIHCKRKKRDSSKNQAAQNPAEIL